MYASPNTYNTNEAYLFIELTQSIACFTPCQPETMILVKENNKKRIPNNMTNDNRLSLHMNSRPMSIIRHILRKSEISLIL